LDIVRVGVRDFVRVRLGLRERDADLDGEREKDAASDLLGEREQDAGLLRAREKDADLVFFARGLNDTDGLGVSVVEPEGVRSSRDVDGDMEADTDRDIESDRLIERVVGLAGSELTSVTAREYGP